MSNTVKLKREGEPFVIYALVDPITLEVKYVGQTSDLKQRARDATAPAGTSVEIAARVVAPIRHHSPMRRMGMEGSNNARA